MFPSYSTNACAQWSPFTTPGSDAGSPSFPTSSLATQGSTSLRTTRHGLFGTYRNKPLGSFGRFATLSFHETKNFTCGEGGALVLNQQTDIDRAQIIHEKGTDRLAFTLGQVDKYTWQDTGSSFGLSDVLAALLLAQLEERESVLYRRKMIFDRYLCGLKAVAAERSLRLPNVPDDRSPAHHIFHVMMPDENARNLVLKRLNAQGIGAAFHYVPLHNSPAGRRYAARVTNCPVSDRVAKRLLRLPLYADLTTEEVDRTIEAFGAAVRDI